MKKWYLQENEQGERFWDIYLHNECKLVTESTFRDGYSPFTPEDDFNHGQGAL